MAILSILLKKKEVAFAYLKPFLYIGRSMAPRK